MANEKFEKENLLEVEKRMQENQNPKKDTTVEGRLPDQQNHMKDQENMRK
ncbi:hypothetical protein [Neobacillus terrae]|nr:hypothetical protein [Neobacillus terrae]NHM32325.1 hypothetical protein [Neobacillus terrae]